MALLISRHSVAQTGDLGGHKLFQDALPLQILRKAPVLVEDSNGKKIKIGLRLGGRFQYADRPNANGRIYPQDVLAHAIEEIQEDIKARRVMGEFDHPPDAKIHLDRVSHIVTKLWMENSEVFGEIEILPKTDFGGQLLALIESNVNIGISSRGVGDMESILHEGNEAYKVLPGYTFVTFDVVAEPSVHGSYLSLQESKKRLMGLKDEGDIYGKRQKAILEEVKSILRKSQG